MSERALATSVGKTQPYSITFEVSDGVLSTREVFEWSESVQFRFEERADGTFDLVFRTIEGHS